MSIHASTGIASLGLHAHMMRRRLLGLVASAVLLLPFTAYAAGPASDTYGSAFAGSAYIRFSELAAGTPVRDQYKSLGFHFSGGTVQAHGASSWLALGSQALSISLRDQYSSAALSTSALSFDIDSAKGGGQFQVQGYNRAGALVSSAIVIGGTRAVVHAAQISSLKIAPLGKAQSWGIGQLRSGADAAPEAGGGSFSLCYTMYYGGYTYTMELINPPAAPVSVVGDSSGCASLQTSAGTASVVIEAYYVPPSSKCATFNDSPVEFALSGFYIPIAFGPSQASGKGAAPYGPLSALRISEAAGSSDAGCSSLDIGNSTIGYVTFEAGVIQLQ